MVTKEALHRLIDELPEEALPTAQRLLVSVRDDAMLRVLSAAPDDDELNCSEDDASASEARRRYQLGDHVTAEEAKARLLR